MHSQKRIIQQKSSYHMLKLRDDECFEYKSEPRFLIYFLKTLPTLFFGSIFSIAGFFLKNQMLNGKGACTMNGRAVPCESMMWFPWVFICVGFLICFLPVVFGFFKYLDAKKVTYFVYNDHIEYEDGFFNQEKKSVTKEMITGIYLKRNFLQRLYGLGTVILSMDNVTVQHIHNFSIKLPARMGGIVIDNIYDSDIVYEEIKHLYDL